jgi:hypothetical protein
MFCLRNAQNHWHRINLFSKHNLILKEICLKLRISWTILSTISTGLSKPLIILIEHDILCLDFKLFKTMDNFEEKT